MPRTKGSKNKPKTVTADFATQIAEKQSAKETLTAEIASITVNIDTLKADLKEKKASLKAIDKEIAKLEAKKAKTDAKAAEDCSKEGRKRSGNAGSEEGQGRCQGSSRSEKGRSGIRSEKAACRRHECR